MKEKIIKYLHQIEVEKEVEILLACETGSRAWGFPSPDSDFDVRFIYRHPKDWYLSLNEQKDTLEMMYENNEIDLSGWDLKKSLNLLWKSNPPLLERIQSPIVYISQPKFVENINELAKNTYSKIATMHHYLNMAKNVFSEIKDTENIKLKRLFYALRSSVACMWILERTEIQPITFHTMLDKLNIENKIKQKIEELIVFKSSKNEDYLHQAEPMLNDFIENNIQNAEKHASILPAGKGNIENMNLFFRENLR